MTCFCYLINKNQDPDLYPNNVTKLYIVNGNELGMFGLDVNNLILNKLPTDFHPFESHLLILAHDGKYTAKAEVLVYYYEYCLPIS